MGIFEGLMNPKQFIQEKSYGFFVTLGVALLTLVTAIVYAATYANTPRFMSAAAVAVMIVGTVLAIVLMLTKYNEYAPAVLALVNLIGLCLFIQIIYSYVVVVMVAIDLDGFEPRFIACVVLFAISLVASIVSIFLKQSKENV